MKGHLSYQAHDPAGEVSPRLAWLCAALLLCTSGMAISSERTQAPSTGSAAYSAVHPIATDMQPIMALLKNRNKITYIVTFIPGGARTVTTSKDPAVANLIQTHAWEMKARMEQGANIRPSDPLFQELFRHHSEITIKLRNIPGGVLEDETSTNPQVVLLIRAHTKAVHEFIQEGMARAKKSNPLPKGYHPDSQSTPHE